MPTMLATCIIQLGMGWFLFQFGSEKKHMPSEFTLKNLLRNFTLLKVCNIPIFTRNAFQIFDRLRTVLGSRIFDAVFKPAVYNIFIAGSTEPEIAVSMAHMEEQGLVPLLSPMLEDDPRTVERNISSKASAAKIHKENLDVIMHCIDYSSLHCRTKQKYLAIKLTAFLPSTLLDYMSSTLVQNGKIGDSVIDSLHSVFISSRQQTNFKNLGSISFDQGSSEELLSGLRDLKAIADESISRRVVLFIDAEYSHLQPAVRLLTLTLMKAYNKETALICNTYQCYLKDSFDHVSMDLETAERMGFVHGGKFVRGAYMEMEQRLSYSRGTIYPIHDSYETANHSYDSIIEFLLDRKRVIGNRHLLLIATHNLDSILKAVPKVEGCQNVHFAQINGMADQLSIGLAQLGYSVLKLVPCGSVSDVLPWLARRMQENAGVPQRAQWDAELIKRELIRRMAPK